MAQASAHAHESHGLKGAGEKGGSSAHPPTAIHGHHSGGLRGEDGMGKAQPRPLPMPEYGGWFAPLTEFLPDPSHPISNFHRCNLALILLTDLVVVDVSMTW